MRVGNRSQRNVPHPKRAASRCTPPIRGVARAGLLLAACILSAACDRPAAFAPSGGAIRLGPSAVHRMAGSVSRPVLDGMGGSLSVEAAPLAGGTLELAATVVPAEDGSRSNAHCRVSFVANGPTAAAARPVVVELDVKPEDRWTETTLRVPAAPSGAILTMDCPEPGSVAWAQPLLLAGTAATRAPLLIVLSLDTLRADHVTGFGNPAKATPALARLASEGVAFTAAASPYTWTLPSHWSLFYSRMYGFPPGTPPLAGLASLLAERGFATAGFTGGGFVSARLHFDLGFDRYTDYNASASGRAEIDLLPEVLGDAGDWIEDHASSPSFVFLHTYAMHDPPPSERNRLFRTEAEPAIELTAEQVAVAREYYGELAGRLDTILAPFFEKLKTVAKDRPTMLVVLSDHGEAFREHGNLRHGVSGPDVTLHDELVHVPMIFWAPGVVGAREAMTYPFSLLDVAPTLLASVGVDSPPGMVGRNFWPLLRGGLSLSGERDQSRWNDAAVSYKSSGWGVPGAWASRTATRKRIVRVRAAAGTANVEAYDLDADPGERVNLAESDRRGFAVAAIDELKELLGRLEIDPTEKSGGLPLCPHCAFEDIERFWDLVLPNAGAAAGQSRPIDPATQQRLRALGYLN
jgi:arylsulfatase A-like enzyme